MMRSSDRLRITENAKEVGTNAVESIGVTSRQIRDYAVAHKAITIAGAVALGLVGFGVFVMLRRRED